jgi:hypothetical protein
MNTLSDFEKLSFYREEVRHEFNLLGMRSTMLAFCQSFLVVPFAILNTAASFRTVLAAEYLIAALGVFLAMLLAEPINAAHRTLEKWLLKQRVLQQHSEPIRDLAIDRDMMAGADVDLSRDRDHFRSLAFSRYAPRVFVLFWPAAAIFLYRPGPARALAGR